MAELRCRLLCVMLSLAMIGLQPASLFAQDGAEKEKQLETKPERQFGGYTSIRYRLTRDEVEKFSEILELSPEQHETMMELYIEVSRRMFEAEQPLRAARDASLAFYTESMESLRASREADPEIARQAYQAFREGQERYQLKIREEEERFQRVQDELSEEFFQDLPLLLTPEQAELLDDAFRWRHRSRLLRYGMIPYSDFSVADVARSMELRIDADRFGGDEQPSLESIYKEYEIELDRLLVRRVEAEHEFAGGARGMGDGRSGSDDAGSEEDQEKWREAVGEVNLRLVNMQKKYIRRIASLLEPEPAAEFQQRCYQKAYWHVLADESMDRLFSELLEEPSLTEEQRAHVTALQAEYEAAKAPISREWIRALDEYLAKGGAQAAGAEVPAAAGDLRNRSGGGDGLFAHVKAGAMLRGEWKERIAKLRIEYGLDEPEEEADDD